MIFFLCQPHTSIYVFDLNFNLMYFLLNLSSDVFIKKKYNYVTEIFTNTFHFPQKMLLNVCGEIVGVTCYKVKSA